MNYEEKYKQALERAKKELNICGSQDCDAARQIFRFFPELKDEDERIRKALIEMVHDTTGDSLWVDYNVHKEDALAWFEKQGEQKPADKVEPKFKIGDWVIDKQGIVHQIANVIENVTCHTYGYDIVGGGYFNDNTEGVRLWTIQDAKDGDVLTYNDSENNVYVCIFKEYANERVYDYCTLDKESFWEYGNWNYLASFSYMPATKEQRDLLFQKMKEEGYEWDDEKKELKIIDWSKHIKYEPNSPSIIEESSWSEEDEKRLQSCLNVLQARGIMEDTETVNTKWLKSLRPQNRWKPNDEQMKALWEAYKGSEEQAALASLYSDLKKLKRE